MLGRELFLADWLDVFDLVHGLAEPGEFPVHLFSAPGWSSQGLVLGPAVPGVVAQDIRERELLGGVEALAGSCSRATGTYLEGELPPHVRARASFGPETCAQAANLTCAHYIPVHRATLLLCQLAGAGVPAGWMAGIRGRAAALVAASGFPDRVRELLKTAPAIHADETRAAGGTRYVHLACTRYLTSHAHR